MAQAFFREAVRHLQDARVLHVSRRPSGSITSAMKAVELALKSTLFLYGAARWMDTALNTHSVLGAIQGSKVFTQAFLDALANHDTALLSDIELLEELVPAKPDVKKLEVSQAANTEYPFFAFVPGALPSTAFRLYTPGMYFTGSDSRKHFDTAYRLLSSLQALSPEMAGWRVRLCRPV